MDDMPEGNASTGKPWIDNAYTIWVCQCCLLVHANDECCADDTHGGDGRKPLSALNPDDGLAMGLSSEEHADDCLRRTRESQDVPDDYECECETRTFSTSPCEGCGSFLHGSRHALTTVAHR